MQRDDAKLDDIIEEVTAALRVAQEQGKIVRLPDGRWRRTESDGAATFVQIAAAYAVMEEEEA